MEVSGIKKIITESKHAWRDLTDCYCDILNRKIRKEIESIFNMPPSPREEEIKQIIADEKRKYESDKSKFYVNPIHWSNNKRRRAGLKPLRGRLKKIRTTKYPAFKPTPRVFFAIEDIIDKMFANQFCSSEYFNNFVEVKDIGIGDKVYEFNK